jgi:acyl-CoA synthetase (AMP-forming)/AMP-acid ligase II
LSSSSRVRDYYERNRICQPIIQVYGLTETYGPYSICQWQPGWRSLPAPGRAALLSRQGVGMIQADELRVVDDEMNDVATDGETMGEIVMRGNNVMKGYFDDPKATAGAVPRRLVSLRRPPPARSRSSSCASVIRPVTAH